MPLSGPCQNGAGLAAWEPSSGLRICVRVKSVTSGAVDHPSATIADACAQNAIGMKVDNHSGRFTSVHAKVELREKLGPVS